MIIKDLDFESVHTFECGQCFRWNLSDRGYVGVAADKVCFAENNNIICNDEDADFWRDYFRGEVDYGDIKKMLVSSDKKLAPCIKYGGGIRILHQDLWEMIISFIISANNNIPRIKGIIEKLCESFGEPIEFQGERFYSFPTAERLSGLKQADLAHLKAGYRDRYILDAAQKVASGEVDLEALKNMPTVDAKKMLMRICGVGSKVADCILLFSLERYEVFPQDVWIKRILKDVYNVDEKDVAVFAADMYGEYAGIAQQYLYYYYRDNK